MIGNFAVALPEVLRYEGGYVNHPSDPGGPTNKGITQRTYNAWRASRGLATRSVRGITGSEVSAIYKRDYWDKVGADGLPPGVDFAVFDFAVNSGPYRAAQYLQRILNVATDGRVGPITLAAAASWRNQHALIDEYMDRRMAFLRALGTWGVFGDGWTKRVVRARQMAHNLVADPTPPPPDVPKAEPKAEPASTGFSWIGGAVFIAIVGAALFMYFRS